MTGDRDTTSQQNALMSDILVGVTAVLLIIGSLCVLAVPASVGIAGLWSLGSGGYLDPEMQEWAVGVGNKIVMGGCALALAPWVVVCTVVPILWGIWFWRVRYQRGRSGHDSQ